MRRLIILGISIAALAVPATALANVAVENGVGSVGKGDVQYALGGNNAAFDTYASSVKFSVNKETVFRLVYRCNGVDYINEVTNKAVQPIAAHATKSANGRQITGWNLTGQEGAVTSSVTTYSNSSAYFQAFMACGFKTPETLPTDDPTVSTGILQVTGNGVTKDLPNTPVPAPVV